MTEISQAHIFVIPRDADIDIIRGWLKDARIVHWEMVAEHNLRSTLYHEDANNMRRKSRLEFNAWLWSKLGLPERSPEPTPPVGSRWDHYLMIFNDAEAVMFKLKFCGSNVENAEFMVA